MYSEKEQEATEEILQFDGMDGDTHQMYLPVLPEGARVMRFGTGADCAAIPTRLVECGRL